jgi:hypothetical protein
LAEDDGVEFLDKLQELISDYLNKENVCIILGEGRYNTIIKGTLPPGVEVKLIAVKEED